jgi:rubrerythrin
VEENKLLDIVKGAILLEHKGKALYESVVQTTQVDAVKDLFAWLVREEEKHIGFLEVQYKRLAKGQGFDVSEFEESHAETAELVITEEIVTNVFGAGYEAAVISAALEFEKKAVNFYTQQADSAKSAEEKEVFQWLSKWEKTHMQMLAEVDDELKEQIWFNHQFWPLD